MKLKLYNILLEQTELFEIAQKIKERVFEKFKIEEPSASDENIKYYIDEFEKRKGNPSITKKDIQTYSFKELEKVIDSLPTNQKISKSDNNVEFSNTELIYNQTPLQIYHGSNEKTCIKIKGDFPSSWCVSRSTGGNMYNTYRYAGTEPSFYFVKNIDRLNKITEIEEDLYCFFVIQFNNQGEYIVTNAKNDGDNPMTWEEILKLEPLLQGKEGLFKNVPLTDEEKEYYRRFKDGIPDNEYRDLSYKEKKIYIAIKHKLTDKQFINTPKDLINDYITTGVALTQEQFDFIKDKQSLVNNYRRVTIDIVIPEYIKERVIFHERWLVLTDEEALELYKKKTENFNLIKKLQKTILKYKPMLFDKINIDVNNYLNGLVSLDIKNNLIKYPKLIDKYQDILYRLYKSDISDILRVQPQLIDYFKGDLKLEYYVIKEILIKHPQLVDKYKDFLKSYNIDSIIKEQPQLFEKFKDKIDNFEDIELALFLATNPKFIDIYKDRVNKFSNTVINIILEKQPQLKPYFDNIKPINENIKLKFYSLLK